MAPRSDTIGEFELAILLAIAHLGDDAYGVAIRKEISDRIGRDVAVGALYTGLHRLEQKGLISSSMSEPLAQRGGRPRRQVKLRPAGITALSEARSRTERMWAGLNPSIWKRRG